MAKPGPKPGTPSPKKGRKCTHPPNCNCPWCKTKPCTEETKQKLKIAQEKYHREHPNAIKEWHNAPEVFEFIQQYGSLLINNICSRYYNLKDRCNNPNHGAYKYYGGRGIQNLFTSVEHFLFYVINELHITKFSQIDGLEIDRIDNNSHYMPGNIRFVTRTENNNNRHNILSS